MAGDNTEHDFSGLVLKDVVPKRDKPWWRDWTLVKLNLLLLCALLTQTAQGFDASMINGVQSLPQWSVVKTLIFIFTFVNVMIQDEILRASHWHATGRHDVWSNRRRLDLHPRFVPALGSIRPTIPYLRRLDPHHHRLGLAGRICRLCHVRRISLHRGLWSRNCLCGGAPFTL